MNTENLMDIDFKQADQLAFVHGGVQPKPRMVRSVKINWKGLTGDTWDAFNHQLLGWGSQVGIGFMFNVTFRLEYKANGSNSISKLVREFTNQIQFNHNLEHLYGALQMACAYASPTKDLFTLYAMNQNASRDVTPANGLNLYRAMLYYYGKEGNIRCEIQKTLNELRDLKYDKWHGKQSFKEVARTFWNLYTRMAGQDFGQTCHTIPSE
jgi:hypothetical protein